MKLKQLEAQLQKVEPFREPNILLEQYPTTPHLASQMIYNISSVYNDIQDRVVVDLGTGCGVLGIGAILMGAKKVFGIDIDKKALEIARQNCDALDIGEEFECIEADLSQFVIKEGNIYASESALEPLFKERIDVVIMNPPFGTKKKGIDMTFLSWALSIASLSVYSLHKSTTRAHVLRSAGTQAKGEVMAQMKFNIPQTFKCHKQDTVDVAVDLVHFTKTKAKT